MTRTLRRTALVVTLLGLGWGLGRLETSSIVRAGATPTATRNGDADGDGSLTIGDAIYLLNWLFRDGPPLVPFDCPSSGGAGLLETGQTLCFDAVGAPVDCSDPQFPGQDGAVDIGCGGSGRFTSAEHGLVIDSCTGLMWQGVTGSGPSRNWSEALTDASVAILAADGTWVGRVEDANARGGVLYDDWRIPNVRELESIADFGRAEPAVDPSLVVAPAGYWSSTTSTANPQEAWCINYATGQIEPILKLASLKVVLVRGGSPSVE